jgi:hypothetical protein
LGIFTKRKWLWIPILVIGISLLIALGLCIYGYFHYAKPFISGDTEKMAHVIMEFAPYFHRQDIRHCDMDIRVDPESGKLEGTITVTVNRMDTSKRRLYFLLNPGLEVESITAGSRRLPKRHLWLVLWTTLPQDLEQEEEVDITISYQGRIKGVLGGWNPGKIAPEEVILWDLSFWYPQEVFFYGDRLTARVKITLPKEFKTITAGHFLNHEIQGSEQIVEWEMKVPDYRFPLLAGKWESWQDRIDGKDMAIYASPELNVDGDRMLEFAEFGLTHYLEWFGDTGRQHYSFLITGERNLYNMYGGGGTVIMGGRYQHPGHYEFLLINHELAHNWIPGLFGISTPFQHDWIPEGFAEYAALEAARHYFPEEEYADLMWAYKTFDPNLPKPISQTPGLISKNRVLDKQLAYHKGLSVYMMLEQILGEERFKNALNHCCQSFCGQEIKPQTYLKTIEDIGGKDLEDFYNNWVYDIGCPDFSIQQVEEKNIEGTKAVEVTIQNTGDVSLPYEIDAACVKGDEAEIKHLILDKSPKKVAFSNDYGFQKIIVDPKLIWADMNRSNNIYPLSPEIITAISCPDGEKLAVVRKDYSKHLEPRYRIFGRRRILFSSLFMSSALEIYNSQGKMLSQISFPGEIMVRSYGGPMWDDEGEKLLLRHWDYQKNISQMAVYDLSSRTHQNIGEGYTPRWLKGGEDILFGKSDGTLNRMSLSSKKEELLADGLGRYIHPNLSPSGEEAVVVDENKLFLIVIDDTSTKLLFGEEGLKNFTAWSADGEKLYWIAEKGDRDYLHALHIRSGEKEPILYSEESIQYLSVSSDGEYLLYITKGDHSDRNTYHLWNFHIGKEKIVHETKGEEIYLPSWAADGKSLYFVFRKECQPFPSTFYACHSVVAYDVEQDRENLIINQ